MKKVLLLTLICFIVNGLAFAQSYSTYSKKPSQNFYVSTSLVNKTKLDFSFRKLKEKDVCDVDYKGTTISLGYERRGLCSPLFQLDYTKGKVDYVTFNDNCPSYWHPKFEDFNMLSLAYFYDFGLHLPRYQKFHVFLYPGAGIDFVKGGPINHTYFSFKAKARVIYYIFNQLGVHVGINWNRGWSFGYSSEDAKNKGEKDNQENGTEYEGYDLKLRYGRFSLEAGLTYTFK